MLPLASIDKNCSSLTKEDRGLDFGAQVSDSLICGEPFGIVYCSGLIGEELLFYRLT